LLEKAGPRERLFFDPVKVHAGIVTCGGLCPGLNNVIRSAVLTLWHRYGVRRISGIRYGYRGLLPEQQLPVEALTPEVVSEIHRFGGTALGSSRGGGERIEAMVDTMERMNLSMLFTVGGDGTQRGAQRLAQEIARRKLPIAVVGIPKTIDNDLSFVERSFGFETAVSRAVEAVNAAHVEARDAIDGICIVKVMGRESGFIAAHTALATNDVNFVLVPEVPFDIDGPDGFLAHLEARIRARHHAVIVLAEGAGQEHVESTGRDPSGNRKLGDFSTVLRERIARYFASKEREVSLRFIDPSYIIRAAPANPADAIYCAQLGASAVHAAMSGRTSCLVGLVNNRLVHVPIGLATHHRNRLSPESPLWRDVLETTGQATMVNPGRAQPSTAM
ncbi:MAG TPA: ATP-dependent 6-phosphofructokinase, partial [Polyangiaceae bacterium]|nr:ATP-dependent 6-phosphofructokinase [Polyangiaceae bacterium]